MSIRPGAFVCGSVYWQTACYLIDIAWFQSPNTIKSIFRRSTSNQRVKLNSIFAVLLLYSPYLCWRCWFCCQLNWFALCARDQFGSQLNYNITYIKMTDRTEYDRRDANIVEHFARVWLPSLPWPCSCVEDQTSLASACVFSLSVCGGLQRLRRSIRVFAH